MQTVRRIFVRGSSTSVGIVECRLVGFCMSGRGAVVVVEVGVVGNSFGVAVSKAGVVDSSDLSMVQMRCFEGTWWLLWRCLWLLPSLRFWRSRFRVCMNVTVFVLGCGCRRVSRLSLCGVLSKQHAT